MLALAGPLAVLACAAGAPVGTPVVTLKDKDAYQAYWLCAPGHSPPSYPEVRWTARSDGTIELANECSGFWGMPIVQWEANCVTWQGFPWSCAVWADVQSEECLVYDGTTYRFAAEIESDQPIWPTASDQDFEPACDGFRIQRRFSPFRFTACQSDFDANGQVDFADLSELLLMFGFPLTRPCQRWDLDQSDQIDTGDVALLLLDMGNDCRVVMGNT